MWRILQLNIIWIRGVQRGPERPSEGTGYIVPWEWTCVYNELRGVCVFTVKHREILYIYVQAHLCCNTCVSVAVAAAMFYSIIDSKVCPLLVLFIANNHYFSLFWLIPVRLHWGMPLCILFIISCCVPNCCFRHKCSCCWCYSTYLVRCLIIFLADFIKMAVLSRKLNYYFGKSTDDSELNTDNGNIRCFWVMHLHNEPKWCFCVRVPSTLTQTNNSWTYTESTETKSCQIVWKYLLN